MYPPNDGREDLYIRQDLSLKRPIKFITLIEAMQFLDTNKFPDGDLLREPQSSYRRQYINSELGFMPAITIGDKDLPTLRIFIYPSGESMYFDFYSQYQSAIYLVYQGSGYLQGYNTNQVASFVIDCHNILNKALHPF